MARASTIADPDRNAFYVEDMSIRKKKKNEDESRVRTTVSGDLFAISLFAALFFFRVITAINLGGRNLSIDKLALTNRGTMIIDSTCATSVAEEVHEGFEAGDVDFMKPSRVQ